MNSRTHPTIFIQKTIELLFGHTVPLSDLLNLIEDSPLTLGDDAQ